MGSCTSCLVVQDCHGHLQLGTGEVDKGARLPHVALCTGAQVRLHVQAAALPRSAEWRIGQLGTPLWDGAWQWLPAVSNAGSGGVRVYAHTRGCLQA